MTTKPGAAPSPRKLPAPPPIAALWIKRMLGFGVTVAIGLCPYLGRLDVPFFSPLLQLIPASEQDSLLPFSAALMGIIAVGVQWYGSQKKPPSTRTRARLFRTALGLTLLGFVLLFVVFNRAVVRVPILGGSKYVSFVVGFHDPARPPCVTSEARLGAAECIAEKLTLDPKKISSYWGDGNVNNGRIALHLSYLAFTGSFGFLVGCFVINREVRRK